MTEGRHRHTHSDGHGGWAWSYTHPHPRQMEDQALSAADADFGDEDGRALWEYITSDDFDDRECYAIASWCMGFNTYHIGDGLGVSRERARQILVRGLSHVFEHFNGRVPEPGEIHLIAMRGPNPRHRKERESA